MKTECTPNQIEFHGLGHRVVVGKFDGGKISSDGGGLLLREVEHRTLTSWSRERRVIGKAEQLAKGENPRFVVTTLSPKDWDARRLYEDLYCARGDMENRISENHHLHSPQQHKNALIASTPSPPKARIRLRP